MSAGNELFAKTMFSSDEIRREVDEYLMLMFKQMFRTTLIRKPVVLAKTDLPFGDENAMLRNFVLEYTQELIEKAVKDITLKTYMREELHSFIQKQVERYVKDNLKALEKSFQKQKTIPKGVKK